MLSQIGNAINSVFCKIHDLEYTSLAACERGNGFQTLGGIKNETVFEFLRLDDNG